jgi:hypothetical protein
MEHRPLWEATSHSVTQEFPNILWNPQVYYHVYNSSHTVRILGQFNSIHNTPSCFSKTHFNIILNPTPKFRSGIFPSGRPTKILHALLLFCTHATYPAHHFLLDMVITSRRVQVMKLPMMQFSQPSDRDYSRISEMSSAAKNISRDRPESHWRWL